MEIGEEEAKEVSLDEKQKRITSLLEALRILWGGGRTARMVVDLSPKFLAYARLKVKHPIFLESLSVDEDMNLNIDLLKENLDRMEAYVVDYFFGIETGFFANESEIKQAFSGKVFTVGEAIDNAKQGVSEAI